MKWLDIAPLGHRTGQPLSIQLPISLDDHKAIFQPHTHTAQSLYHHILSYIYPRFQTEHMARFHLSLALWTLIDIWRLVSV